MEPDQVRRPVVPAKALVLGGVIGLESGAAIAATIIPSAGIAGIISARRSRKEEVALYES